MRIKDNKYIGLSEKLDGASKSVKRRKEMISSLESATFNLWYDITFAINY